MSTNHQLNTIQRFAKSVGKKKGTVRLAMNSVDPDSSIGETVYKVSQFVDDSTVQIWEVHRTVDLYREVRANTFVIETNGNVSVHGNFCMEFHSNDELLAEIWEEPDLGMVADFKELVDFARMQLTATSHEGLADATTQNNDR
ncbi:hypothetical protein [Novipirellula rosea]|uniref:Uncharacterized protein n=1 Tax=Novipirellula rosea TaxID=1031540 RepID=A0ABP8MAM8_9BACT